MDELAKSLDKLLKKKNIDKELNEATLYLLQRRRIAIAETRVEVTKFQDAERKLSIVTKFMGEAWAESFGQLKTGSKEADEVLGILKNTFSKIEPLIKPYLDQAKRMMVDAFTQKIGIPAESEIADAIKKLKSGVAAEAAGVDVDLEQPWWETLYSPNVDVKATTDAAKAMQKSGVAAEAAGVGMAEFGASSVAVAEGTAAAGVGMAELGAGSVAAAEGTAAVGVAASSAIPPLALLAAAAAAAYASMVLLSKGFQMNVDQMDNFRRAGHRASGSIRELLDTSTDLGLSLGASIEQAYGTVQALTEAGFAVDSLDESLTSIDGTIIKGQKALLRLAETNLKFVDATGASREEVAKLQKRFTVMGRSAEAQEATFGALTEAASKYGLAGRDVDAMVQSLYKNSTALEIMWGDTSIYSYTSALISLAGAAKNVGIEVSVATQAMDDILNITDRAIMLAARGGGFEAFLGDDPIASLNAVADGVKALAEDIENAQGRLEKKVLFEAYGYSFTEGSDLIVMYDKMLEQRNEMAAMSEEEIAHTKLMEASRKALDEGYESATQTLSLSFQRLLAPLLMMAANVMGPLVDGIMEVVEFIRPALEEITSAFGALWDGIKEVFEPFMPTIRVLAKMMSITLLMALHVLTTGIKTLGWALSYLGMVLQVLFAPWNWFVESVELLVDWILECTVSFGKFVDEVSAGFQDLISPITEFVDWFKTIYGVIVDLGDVLFGSSFLHIKEGIAEIMPFLSQLWEAFRFLTSPIQWIKSAIDSASAAVEGFSDEAENAIMRAKKVKETIGIASDLAGVAAQTMGMSSMGFALNAAGDALDVWSAFEDKPHEIGKAESELVGDSKLEKPEKPMSVYTVKFSDDLMTNEAENKSIATANIVEMTKQIKMLVNKGNDINNEKTANILERMEQKMGNNIQREAKHDSSRRAFGEKLNRWW